MEFTLDSALSGQSVMGHAAYVMLIASMLMRTLLWLRVLVIVSACLGIAYSMLILRDPVSTFWETCLVVVNIFQLLRSHWRSIRASFSETEAGFIARHLPGLSRGEARSLIDVGTWEVVQDGTVLAVEGEAVSHLIYLAEGTADVRHGGAIVARCPSGTFVGEMTVITAAPATATVVVSGTATVWRVQAQVLRSLLAREDDIARELDAAFARNFREKLVQMNTWVAAGAIPA